MNEGLTPEDKAAYYGTRSVKTKTDAVREYVT